MSKTSRLGSFDFKKQGFFVVFICALLVFGSSLSLLNVTGANTPTFNPAINLSNDTSNAKDPAVSNNGQNVYIVWTEESKGIYFRMSSDGGNTWVPPTSQLGLKVSPKGGVASFPVMFTQFQQVTSGDVYLAWSQTIRQTNGSLVSQVFVSASTNNGLSFSTTQVSDNSTHAQSTPTIAAAGSDVYVGWFSSKISGQNGSDYVSSSKNNGATWAKPVDIVPSEAGGEVQIVASGSNAYYVADGIFFSASYNNGNSWSQSIHLFNSPPRTTTSIYSGREPWVAANANLVYVIWEANSTTPGISYHDQSVTSKDGGRTWGKVQNVTDPLKDNWEPENVAVGNSVFVTFHGLGTNGIYATSSVGVTSNSPTWSTPQLLSPTKLTSSFAHIFTSDGSNIFVLWGQQISSGSSVWDAYVAYSSNSGTTWSSPINISNNAAGVAAGNQDVTLFSLASNGAHCFAAWTYTVGTTSQIYFAHS